MFDRAGAARIAIVVALISALRPVWAQAPAPDYSADMAAAKSFMTGVTTTVVPVAQQKLYGNIDTGSVGALGGSGATIAGHNAANRKAINDCVAAAKNGFPSMSDQQKLNCNAIITAANITYTPNPYLDAKNPDSLQASGTATRLLNVQRQQVQAVQSGAVANPLAYSSTTTNCEPTSTQVPAVQRLDYCRAEKAVKPVTCSSTVTATVQDGQVSESENKSACSEAADNSYCVPAESTCELTASIDTGTKDAAGNPILQEVCAKRTYGYDCWDAKGPWDYKLCDSLAATCQPTGKFETMQLVSGEAVWQDVEYSCVIQPATVQTSNGCQTSICLGGTCFDATTKPSQDFTQATVGMEILREAGVYAHSVTPTKDCIDPASVEGYVKGLLEASGRLCKPDAATDMGEVSEIERTLKIFSGIPDHCKRPTGPMPGKNCCEASGAGALKTNRDILPSIAWQAAGSAVMSAGKYGFQQASNYMYDFMYNSGNEWLVDKAISSYGAWHTKPEFSMSLSAYGFTMQIGAPSSMAGSLGQLLPNGATELFKQVGSFIDAGNVWTTTEVIGGVQINLSFNPYLLAAAIAIQAIMSMMACTQDEQLLSLRRGGGLCLKTGEACSKRLPKPLKTCLQITEHWCCWNSQLAKLVAVEGGAQLGGGPRCGGFSPQELAMIDFSKIDFSGFMQQVLASTSVPDATYNASTLTQASKRARQGQTAVSATKVADTVVAPPSDLGGASSKPALQDYVQGVVSGMQAK